VTSACCAGAAPCRKLRSSWYPTRADDDLPTALGCRSGLSTGNRQMLFNDVELYLRRLGYDILVQRRKASGTGSAGADWAGRHNF
jgi:hypothetical protein